MRCRSRQNIRVAGRNALRATIVGIVLLFVSTSVHAHTRLRVVTSIYILASIVQQIGGKEVNVDYLIPPGSNPHLFSPRPRTLLRLSDADAFIGVGLGFEFWSGRIGRLLHDKRVLFIGSLYPKPLQMKRISDSVVANPHVWLDPYFMAKRVFRRIADLLCSVNPDGCSGFRKRAKQLSKRVLSIANSYRSRFAHYGKSCIVDVKPAFEYMLRAFGLRSCCVVVKSGAREPTIGGIRCALRRCRCKNGAVIYVSDRRLAELLARRLKYHAVQLDPLGEPGRLSNYTKLIEHNLSSLTNALK